MHILIERPKKELDKEFEGTVKELLEELGINIETVIIARNNELVTEDEQLKDSDDIRIMSVVSGG